MHQFITALSIDMENAYQSLKSSMEAHMHSMLGKQEKGKNIINIYMCTLSHRLYNIVSIIYKHMCTTLKKHLQ